MEGEDQFVFVEKKKRLEIQKLYTLNYIPAPDSAVEYNNGHIQVLIFKSVYKRLNT